MRQLISEIEDNLANHLASNAVFLAERLLAEQDSEETRGILAECYMAECYMTENKYYKVFEVLKHCRSEMNRYRFALVCLKLHKYDGKTDKFLLGFLFRNNKLVHVFLKRWRTSIDARHRFVFDGVRKKSRWRFCSQWMLRILSAWIDKRRKAEIL